MGGRMEKGWMTAAKTLNPRENALFPVTCHAVMDI